MSHKSGHVLIDLAPPAEDEDDHPIQRGRYVRIQRDSSMSEDDIVELVRLALRDDSGRS